jgi:hypothetical protein
MLSQCTCTSVRALQARWGADTEGLVAFLLDARPSSHYRWVGYGVLEGWRRGTVAMIEHR